MLVNCKMESDRLSAYLMKAFDIVKSAARPVLLSELTDRGVTRTAISQLVQAGLVERPVRGVYHVPNESDDQRLNWACLALAYDCVFCLQTAAAYHGLTEESIGILDAAIPAGKKSPDASGYDVQAEFYRWTEDNLSDGIEEVEIQKVLVKITSAPRTVVDLYIHSDFNPDMRVRKVVPENTFLDAITRLMSREDQSSITTELRRIAVRRGCWDDISKLAGVISTTKANMLAF